MRSLPVAVASLLIAIGLAGCGSSDDTATDSTPTAASSPSSTSPSAAASTSAPSSAPASGTCDYPSDGQSAAKPNDPPPAKPSVSGKIPVLISTSAGRIAAVLDADKAPCTVNSFVSLGGQGYFDKTPCHRLTTPASGIAVLQCGDPSGSGMGGPGYSFADELSGSEQYTAGTLAMANAGPDTNGSQFFMVYADSQLSPDYTVFGHLTRAGLKTLRAIGARGTADGAPDGAPKVPVTIRSVTFAD